MKRLYFCFILSIALAKGVETPLKKQIDDWLDSSDVRIALTWSTVRPYSLLDNQNGRIIAGEAVKSDEKYKEMIDLLALLYARAEGIKKRHVSQAAAYLYIQKKPNETLDINRLNALAVEFEKQWNLKKSE